MHAAVGAVGLAGVVAGALLVTTAAASHRSFLVPLSDHALPRWLAGPFAGLGPRLDQTQFEVVVVAMCACYFVALGAANSVSKRTAIVVIAALHAILFLGPPLLSPDVATYLAYARLGMHGLDPYTHAPSALPVGDALRPWLFYRTGPTNYGPPFTLLTYPLAHLSLPAALWLLKFIAAAASLCVVALTALCARLRGVSPVAAALLVGLNPVLLLFAVGGDHNDLLMMAVLMAGVWLTLKARPNAGAVGGVLAAGLKISAAPAAVFMILGSPRRRQAVMVAALTVLVLAVIAVAGFGHVGVLLEYAKQVYRGEHAFARRYSAPALAGQLLGLGGVHGVTAGVRLVAGMVFVVVILVLLLRLYRGADWVSCAAWAQLAALVTTTWLWSWYIVWLLPLAALARRRLLPLAALALTIFLVATQVFVPLG